MPGKLARGNGVFDAVGHEGDEPTVFIRSDAAPGVIVIAATYGGAKVAIGDNGSMKLPPLQAGTTNLTLVIDGVQTGDDIQLFEDGFDGDELCRGVVGSAPGGASPRIGFRIHV